LFSFALVGSACLSTPALAQDAGEDGREIVVNGQRTTERSIVSSMAQDVTRRPRIDKPISRRYDAVCLGIYGMTPETGLAVLTRVEGNLETLGIAIGKEGCQINSLIAFVRNGPTTVRALRKEHPQLFEGLLDFEIDRIFAGTGAAQAWQTTLVKGADGKEFYSGTFGDPPREVEINKSPQASHLTRQIRADILGAAVVFDNSFIPGKTTQQLADYATMRLVAPTADLTQEAGVASILTLFAEDNLAPEGLTDFDHAYLTALYRLAPTAGGSAIRGATWTEYRKLTKDTAEGAETQ
jgi:hypothetical protein